ncbi:MAG: late competence development ComFB family protein [Gemmatimonadota bacterium]|nr:MAG: late competence development ComFB family protein [Gemmatimonadota bacterium]
MKNLVEEFVIREYDLLAPKVEGFCGCELCRADVLVYALNRLRPHYVAQATGEVLEKVAQQSEQPVADVSVVLLDGFRKVQAAPRNGHPPAK